MQQKWQRFEENSGHWLQKKSKREQKGSSNKLAFLSLYLKSFVTQLWKVVLKYDCINLTGNICAALWSEQQMQSNSHGHSPGWAEEVFGQCFGLFLLPLHECMWSYVLLCLTLSPCRLGLPFWGPQQPGCLKSPSKCTAGLTPCFPQLFCEMMEVPTVVASP